MRPVAVTIDARVGKWLPGEPGEPGAFHGPLGIVVPAMRAVRDGSFVKVGRARLRADAVTPGGAMAALHAATSAGVADLVSGPEVCGSLLGWAYMLPPEAEVHEHHG